MERLAGVLPPFSPVHKARKFSTVLGTTSPYRPMTEEAARGAAPSGDVEEDLRAARACSPWHYWSSTMRVATATRRRRRCPRRAASEGQLEGHGCSDALVPCWSPSAQLQRWRPQIAATMNARRAIANVTAMRPLSGERRGKKLEMSGSSSVDRR